MSKTKFYSMTKPIPFRKTKLFIRKAKDIITSLIYNILYKLNIIEKYSFNDVMRNGVPVTIPSSKFESGCISATLEFSVEHTNKVNECYYHKKGDRLKKLYVVTDSHLHELHITAHMTNIGIKMPDGKFHYVREGLPVFKIQETTLPILPFTENYGEDLSKPQFTTHRIDMRKLQSLGFCYDKIVSEYYLDELKEGVYEGLFAIARDQFTFAFTNYFRGVKLADLLEEE